MKKKTIMIIFIFVMMIIPVNNRVKADTLGDLYDKLEVLKEKKKNSDNNKKLTKDQIATLNGEIADLNASIENTKDEIVEAEDSIEDSYKKIEEKKEETNELLKFLQISSGENIYLEYLFDAEDYTDFIYRYSIVTQLSDYNQNLMNELETLIKELEQKKIDLADKQKTLETKRVSLNSKMDTLRGNLSQLNEEGTTIEQDIEDLSADIKYYEDKGCGRNQDITTCAGMPYAKGWKYPLMSGVVTSEYSNSRTDIMVGTAHRGIDLGGNSEGTSVYAAAAGTVARIVYRSSCGGNMVYIYHTVNGKNYTTAYYHLYSIYVSEKQTVYDTTVIGTVGGGSTSAMSGCPSRSSSGYDYCTCGAHLHFGLADGHNAYYFNSYAFNPRDIFYFPGEYAGYFYR